MTGAEMVGHAAGILTTIAFLPQLVKTWRTRSTHDISLGMFATLCLGMCLWLAYGLLMGARPIIFANGITLVLASPILYFKLKYK